MGQQPKKPKSAPFVSPLHAAFEDSASALRSVRLAANLTQDDLAARLGVTAQNVAALEKPGRLASFRSIKKAAEAMGYRAKIVFEPIKPGRS